MPNAYIWLFRKFRVHRTLRSSVTHPIDVMCKPALCDVKLDHHFVCVNNVRMQLSSNLIIIRWVINTVYSSRLGTSTWHRSPWSNARTGRGNYYLFRVIVLDFRFLAHHRQNVTAMWWRKKNVPRDNQSSDSRTLKCIESATCRYRSSLISTDHINIL